MSHTVVRLSSHGNLLKELQSRISNSKEVILLSAYVSPAGIEVILPAINKLLNKGGSLSLYATFDGTVATKPESFRKLVEFHKIFTDRVHLYLYPHEHSLFHAKAFLFKGARGRWSGIIGSANLTRSALTGKNVELSVDCEPLAETEVRKIINEISRLRQNSYFMEVKKDNLKKILHVFCISEVKPGSIGARRQEKYRRESQERKLDRLRRSPPEKLPPLAELAIGSQTFVDELAKSGVGVRYSSELDDVSFSFQLEPFVRAGIVLKQKNESINVGGYTTNKQGQGIRLFPDRLRDLLSAASKSIGKIISAAAVDLGYTLWVPRISVPRMREEIKMSKKVLDAKNIAEAGSPIVLEHLNRVREEFSDTVKDIVAKIPLEMDYKKWNTRKSEEVRTWSNRMTEKQVREKLCDYIERNYRNRISDDFVKSKLGRLSFEPAIFDFSVQRVVGDDEYYGHKHFLACLVWNVTDPFIRRSDGGQGRGEMYTYLNARVFMNISRQKHPKETRLRQTIENYSILAAQWLAKDADLDDVVESFRTFYGDSEWTWDISDLTS